jgi:cell division protein FtsB
MSLDGLRAWIGEVERKLGVRTKVMLALAAIAIGIGGTAIYLAIDTRDNAVSEQDVQELQEELEARIGTGTATDTATLEAEVDALRTQVEALEAGGVGGGGNGISGGSGSGSDDGAGTGADGGTGTETGTGAGSGIGSIPPTEGGAPATPSSPGEK